MLLYTTPKQGAGKINAHILSPFFYFMNIILLVSGGLGKSVMSTAVCKSIKHKYPESNLIVLTAHPDVFLNNPHVHRCIKFNEAKYFYKDYIEGKDFLFFGQEPYQTTEYIQNEKHLIDIWCKLYDLPVLQYTGELYITKREKDFYSRKYDLGAPFVALQTSGNSGELMYNWGRDIPPYFVKSIVKKYSNQKIYHIRQEHQISYDGTIPFTDNIRAVAVLISLSQKRIFMDSSCQHLAAALGLESSVLWVTTNPKVFGYDFNNNLLASPETKSISLVNSFLSKYELVPQMSDFPYSDESEIFNQETLNLL